MRCYAAGCQSAGDDDVGVWTDAMTEVELGDCQQLLRELKALLPAEAPKVIEGIGAR